MRSTCLASSNLPVFFDSSLICLGTVLSSCIELCVKMGMLNWGLANWGLALNPVGDQTPALQVSGIFRDLSLGFWSKTSYQEAWIG